MRRRLLAIPLTITASLLVAAAGAQAIVVNDAGTKAGVSLVPSTRGNLLPTGVSAVTASAPCTDHWLSSDLGGPFLAGAGLCYQGGAVAHKNETFALTWDQDRAYWSGTRGYLEQFLRDVADGSGSLATPYAITQQYQDANGRAGNASLFGGGCIDYGATGGSACEFGNPTSAGHNFPANGCKPTGDSFLDVGSISPNTICLTDAQLQGELSTMITQTGILSRTQPGYTPVVTLLLPADVETCLDAAATLCSVNGSLTPPQPTLSTSTTGGSLVAGTYHVEITYVTSTGESLPSAPETIATTGATSTITIDSPVGAAGVTGWHAYITAGDGDTYSRQEPTPNAIGTPDTLDSVTGGPGTVGTTAFCSYHSQVNVDGTEVAYVVLPWTAVTSCDETDVPAIPKTPTPEQLATEAGQRLVSPLSQAQIATIVNPGLNGWYALDGREIDDNGGCQPLTDGLDTLPVGSSSQNPYYLQREYNNAAVLESDPATYFGCAPDVILQPAFVVPSAIDSGDVVEFDGSATVSTLIVPKANYTWNFGDGQTGVGPSVETSYAKGGTYTVTLNVTDRGGYSKTLSQKVTVLGPNGQQPSTQSPQSKQRRTILRVRIVLMPQSLRGALQHGIAVRVTSNEAADGIATLSISRKTANRADIRHSRGATVVIGRGTVSGIKAGNVKLHLHLPHAIARKLARLHHLTLSVRLAVLAAGGAHEAIDAAGRY